MIGEVAALFLKLGTVGFGGPPAHISMMEDQCVARKKWVTPEQFSEGLALCNLLPGPASTQLAIWLGYMRAGVFGAVTAGVCFILPCFVMLLGLSWAYFRYGAMPQMRGIFAGIGPAVIAIILATCWRLGKAAVKSFLDALVLVGMVVLTYYGVEVVLTLLGAGLLGILRARWKSPAPPKTANGLIAPLLIVGMGGKLLSLALVFLKTGAFLFGGGLVSLPFIQHEVVYTQGWMTTREFLDGVALGQVTPGPVIITAAFIGYKVGGVGGASIATFCIFFPPALFILLAAPQLERMKKLPTAQAFLKGVAPAVVGAILAACIPLTRTLLTSTPSHHLWFPALILLTSLLVLLRTKIGTPWIVVSAGIVGLLFASISS